MGLPSASTTRPRRPSPVGTSTMAPVRLTTSPSRMRVGLRLGLGLGLGLVPASKKHSITNFVISRTAMEYIRTRINLWYYHMIDSVHTSLIGQQVGAGLEQMTRSNSCGNWGTRCDTSELWNSRKYYNFEWHVKNLILWYTWFKEQKCPVQALSHNIL